MKKKINILINWILKLIPGILVAIIIALISKLISLNYQAPSMLIAIILGMSFNFLDSKTQFKTGLTYSSQSILKLGIIILGSRISLDLIQSIDLITIIIVSLSVVLTILFGIIILRAFDFDWKFGVLLGGAVAICGASAAMAIASVLPKDKKSDERLTFVIIGVTLLSTLAMIFYPVLANVLMLDQKKSGIFLGATIHDVAQVVGAGFSMSDYIGETSTLIKLFRVTLLFPVVLVISLIVKKIEIKNYEINNTPLIPPFILLFALVAVLSSTGIIPDFIKIFFSVISEWCLLIAIAAIGVKTNFLSLRLIGIIPAFLILITSLFLLVFILLFI